MITSRFGVFIRTEVSLAITGLLIEVLASTVAPPRLVLPA
jgi:hypothetical protein